ncbi:MAG: IS1634 family transposase [Bacteroidaceae bacterium]|nr:IS1634 family transposase [Bacteroidaceae bacterium]
MFVKKKPNRSGSTTVVVAEKEKGAVKYLKTIGTSRDPAEIAGFVGEGEAYIASRKAAMYPELDFDGARERAAEAEMKATEAFLSRIESVLHDAPKRILDRVFDTVGFRAVGDDIFRSLVIARLSFPSSKRATVEYLKSYFDEDFDLHKIYRYLDGLNDTRREEIQAVSVRHTMEVYGGKIGVLFYDVTTLYFESDKPDKLRKPGYSKDGKHSNPQIVLGLLVSGDGCPLAYAVHEGSKYEGHTMLPVVTEFVEKYKLEDFVVVADSGMMSEANLSDLEGKGYKYIVGARIRNMSEETREWILSRQKKQDEIRELVLDKGKHKRLLVGYSEERAALDAKNREKGVKKLKAKYATGTVTKSKITQRGYNRFLKVTGGDRITVTVDDDMVAADAKWDGLKGYISNAELTPSAIVDAYHQLYNVEQSFRISKSKLEIRPIFHFNGNRIKAHISICFVALKVYRELDRMLKNNKMKLSVDTVLSIAKTIPTISVKMAEGTLTKTLFLTKRQQTIKPLFEENFWGSQTSSENQ